MAEFTALIKAQLDAGSVQSELQKLCKEQTVNLKVGNIDRGSLDSFLKTAHEINLSVSSSSIAAMKSQIQNALNNIQINPTFGGQGGKGGKNARQFANVVSDVTNKAIQGVSSQGIGQVFQITPQQSRVFHNEIDSLISDIQKNKGSVVDIKLNTKMDYDSALQGEIEKLNSATVKYKNSMGEVITEIIRWKQIGETVDPQGNTEAIMGWAQATATYSRSLQQAEKQAQSFYATQQRVANNFKNTAKQIYQGATDPNASKKITDQTHLDDLQTQYSNINAEIQKLSTLSGDAFVDQQNKIKGMITDLKLLRDQYRNAESSATLNKAKTLDTQKSEYASKIKGLEADMQKTGVSSQELTTYLNDMNKALTNPNLDMSGMDQVVQTYTKASAELSKLRKEQQASQSQEKAQIKADTLTNEISNMEKANADLQTFEATINGAKVSISSLKAELAGVQTAGDVSVITAKWKAFTEAAKEQGIALKEFKDYSKEIDDIDQKISKVGQAFQNGEDAYGLTKQYAQIKQNLEEINQLRDQITQEQALGANANTEVIAENISRINQLLGTTERSIAGLEAPITAIEAQTSSNKMLTWLQTNSKAAKKYGEEIQNIATQMAKAQTVGEQRQLESQFKNVTSQALAEGLGGLSFTDQFIQSASKIAQFAGIYNMVRNVIMRVPREMVKAVREVDTAMVELRKVSDASDMELDQAFDKATESAKKYGVAISDVVNSTADWKRLGYSLDEAEKLADATTLLQTVGDNMTQETASQAIVSTLQGFKMSTSEVSRVVDLYNEIARMIG